MTSKPSNYHADTFLYKKDNQASHHAAKSHFQSLLPQIPMLNYQTFFRVNYSVLPLTRSAYNVYPLTLKFYM